MTREVGKKAIIRREVSGPAQDHGHKGRAADGVQQDSLVYFDTVEAGDGPDQSSQSPARHAGTAIRMRSSYLCKKGLPDS